MILKYSFKLFLFISISILYFFEYMQQYDLKLPSCLILSNGTLTTSPFLINLFSLYIIYRCLIFLTPVCFSMFFSLN